jgi:hypothetical protein
MADEEEPVENIDSDLQSLLDDLQSVAIENGVLGDAEPIDAPATDVVPIPEPQFSDPEADIGQDNTPDLPIESSPTNLADLAAVVGQFDKDYGEVQANLKRDRGRIDTVIDILLQRVRDNADAETDTMSLVKALAVLADTNGHAVKLLDSRSKLLAATKSTINANQTNVNITGVDSELQNILDQPVGNV